MLCTNLKAITRIDAKIATTLVRDKDRVAHSIRHVAAMAENYLPSEADNVSTTRLGKPQFRDWLPSEFGANRTYWEKKGVTCGKLLNGTLTVLTPALTRDNKRAYFRQWQGPRVIFCLRPFRPSTRTLSVILHLSIWRLNQR